MQITKMFSDFSKIIQIVNVFRTTESVNFCITISSIFALIFCIFPITRYLAITAKLFDILLILHILSAEILCIFFVNAMQKG